MFARFILFVLSLASTVTLNAQRSDTLFFDNNGEPVKRSEMDYYKFSSMSDDGSTIVERTFFANHAPRTIIHFTNDDRVLKTDTARAFYESGEKHWIMAYNPDGSTALVKQFHKNGKLKRIENYEKGIFIKGKKYNDAGRRVAFTRFQQLPKYNGGYERMIAYLNRTIKYPRKAKEKNISGTVHVSFIVTKEGQVIRPRVIKSVHPLLDNEALRVVRIMKQWIPGKTNDRVINSRVSIPITFGKPSADEHIPVTD